MVKGKKNKKKSVQVLGSDQDYLAAFLSEEKPRKKISSKGVNKHGLPFVDEYENQFLSDLSGQGEKEEAVPDADEDFEILLEQSLKEKTIPKKKPKPMPLKRRLKRYPGPETDLDLHGFTAIGAQAKAKSFLLSARHQGYFTIRIIVGKGLHSQEGPVLPDIVEDLLKEMRRDKTVLSYKWEGGQKHKSGALIVYLNQFND